MYMSNETNDMLSRSGCSLKNWVGGVNLTQKPHARAHAHIHQINLIQKSRVLWTNGEKNTLKVDYTSKLV